MTLRSADAIFSEVKVFRNCIRAYAHCLKQRRRRLISVRRGGRPIAMLCLTEGDGQRRLSIEELRTPRNGMVSDEVAEAVRAWFLAQDPLIFQSDVGPYDGRLCQRQWQELWKPYWLQKGRNAELPLRVSGDSLGNLRW